MFTPYFWLGAIVIFAGIEAATFNFTSIWFSVGAIAGFFACLAHFPVLWQFICFTAVSALCLAFTRPLVEKLMSRRPTPTNADRNLGRTVQVISPIRPGQPGRVRLDGVDWNAVSEGTFLPGERCLVIGLESTTLTVAPLSENTPATHASV